MDNPMSFSVTPLQALLAIGFQVWLLVFPILILRKLDRLTNLLEEKFGGEEDNPQNPQDSQDPQDQQEG